MNRKQIGIRFVSGICAVMVWWGALYPELTLTPDTYTVVWEDETVLSEEDVIGWDSDRDSYTVLMETDRSKIRCKSRLLMRLEAIFKWLK